MTFELKNSVAVLTGAASGIGAQLALALADKGVSLALVDINETGLQKTLSDVEKAGVFASAHIADTGDIEAVETLKASVCSAHPRVNLLINNAGVTTLGSFIETECDEFDRIMAINFSGPVAITRAFLPLLMETPQAQIVNISSLFGLIGVGSQSAYCASKFALRGFSEALRMELYDSPVGVTVVHPGGVRTNIAKSATIPKHARENNNDRRDYADSFLKLEASKAAAILVRAIEKRKQRVVIGNDAKALSAIQRLFPASYQKLLIASQKRRERSS